MSGEHKSVRSLAHKPRGGLATLTIGALGIVYGDIGTSPLYAMDQLFFGRADASRSTLDVLGGVSLVIWTITIIIAVKYALLVLRAQNDGEGGVFALYALLSDRKTKSASLLLWLLMLGAGLLFGDGMITPAISVLSAVEGLQVATPGLGAFVVPITLLLLTALFAIQFKGTSHIGTMFGPILLFWFVVIAVLGIEQVEHHPEVLSAFNPLYGLKFLGRVGLFDSLLALSALMLVVTGGEAMYADVGHFGALPIRVSWFSVVYPSLLLNYLGQGAYLLAGDPVSHGKLFYSLVPAPLLYPMVGLATAATIIASQALISGAFSLVVQAIRLGLFPRLILLHTHQAHAGQIYIPFVNAALFAGCVLLVFWFRSSAALAAAYGLAVSGVMVITSIAMFPTSQSLWKWNFASAALIWGGLTAISGSFFIASCLKFAEGGFLPLSVGAAVFLVMLTWRWGRKATFAAYTAKPTMTMAELVTLHRHCKVFMERNAIAMSPKPLRDSDDRIPALVQMLWERHGILPRHLILVEVTHRKAPYVHDDRYRVTVFERDKERGSIVGVELSFGFMEEPNVERRLEEMARHKEIDLPPDRHHWIVHVSHENLLPARPMSVLGRLRFRLFIFLRMLSQPAYYYYGLGNEMQLSIEIIPVRLR